ncbi:MAG: CbiX/SirB N-terminal domain-containing protein [Bryobacteraceae bacterium]
MSAGIVIFAHGSSVPAANDAVRTVARAAAGKGAYTHVQVAFLEAHPALDEAVSHLAAEGVNRVLVVPYFLTLGIHLQRDLPGMVEEIRKAHPGVDIRVTPPLDGHPALAQILCERADAALSDWQEKG